MENNSNNLEISPQIFMNIFNHLKRIGQISADQNLTMQQIKEAMAVVIRDPRKPINVRSREIADAMARSLAYHSQQKEKQRLEKLAQEAINPENNIVK